MNVFEKNIIMLGSIKGFGKKSINIVSKKLNNGIQDNYELLEIIQETKEEYPRIKIPSIDELDSASDFANCKYEDLEEYGIDIISCNQVEYPQRLLNTVDYPPILFSKGNKKIINQPSIAIVGSRKPSDYSYKSSYKISYLIAEKSISIVSGLALGCDTAAHNGCISASYPTIAVMPCGLDVIHPQSNEKLARKILKNNGCLLSEYLPKSKITKNMFTDRNRIQSGISEKVIIIETSLKSGTFHTAEYAISHDKELYYLKQNSNSRTDVLEACDYLESVGARMIHNKNDIFKIIESMNNQNVDVHN